MFNRNDKGIDKNAAASLAGSKGREGERYLGEERKEIKASGRKIRSSVARNSLMTLPSDFSSSFFFFSFFFHESTGKAREKEIKKKWLWTSIESPGKIIERNT